MKLAVIPARGGSKRIPRKNIKLFNGKPMIAWSIEAALHSQMFDQVLVSTDDAEIAAVAREAGAAGVCVVNSAGALWPYLMKDTAGEGAPAAGAGGNGTWLADSNTFWAPNSDGRR